MMNKSFAKILLRDEHCSTVRQLNNEILTEVLEDRQCLSQIQIDR
jgi:hypothetical protein